MCSAADPHDASRPGGSDVSNAHGNAVLAESEPLRRGLLGRVDLSPSAAKRWTSTLGLIEWWSVFSNFHFQLLMAIHAEDHASIVLPVEFSCIMMLTKIGLVD